MPSRTKAATVKRLRDHAVLGIFAPSEPVSGPRFQPFEQGLELLRRGGYRPRLASNCRASAGYAAGSVAQRASDINGLLNNAEVDGLLASWGGKSCNQLLAHLDYDAFRTAGKPLLGFSDVGVLSNAVAARSDCVTFYGPNSVGHWDETGHSDLSLLRDPRTAQERNLLGDVTSVQTRAIRPGRATGRLFGGNLSTFALGNVATPYLGDLWRGGVLFWEEVGKSPQLIDQHLAFLANVGLLDGIAGMIIGDFVHPEADGSKQLDAFDMLDERLRSYRFPALYCPTFGHGRFENPPLPIGALCTLDVDAAVLSAEQPIVH